MKIEVSEDEALAFYDQLSLTVMKARMDGYTKGKEDATPAYIPSKIGPEGMTLLASAFAEVKAGRKIEAIKRVCEAIGCGLKEAKDIVEGTPHGTT